MEVNDIIAKDIFNFKRQGLLWNLSHLAINKTHGKMHNLDIIIRKHDKDRHSIP